MRTVSYLIAASALFLQMTTAHADVLFNWNYTDGGSNTGSGTLTATLDSPGVYELTGIWGTANGVTINSLSLFSSPDQLVFIGQAYVVDWQGIGFSSGPLNTDTAFNLAANTAEPGGTAYPQGTPGNPFPGFSCGSAAYCLVGPGDPTALNGSNLNPNDPTNSTLNFPITGVDVSITLAGAVPEPSTWSMMILGLAGVGFVSYRRRRVTHNARGLTLEGS